MHLLYCLLRTLHDFTVGCMGCISRRTCAGPSLRLYWKRNRDHVNGYLDVVTNGVGGSDIRTEYGWDVRMEKVWSMSMESGYGVWHGAWNRVMATTRRSGQGDGK